MTGLSATDQSRFVEQSKEGIAKLREAIEDRFNGSNTALFVALTNLVVAGDWLGQCQLKPLANRKQRL
jgi:hypothetical protein